MTAPPPSFDALIDRLHALNCPFVLDLTQSDLTTPHHPTRYHLIHHLIATIAPTLPTQAGVPLDALAGCCAWLGVCGSGVGGGGCMDEVGGVEGGGWLVNGRVLCGLLKLAEACQASSPSLDAAFEAHVALLAAGCDSAASLLSTELHLFPADVLLTSKQLSQQQTGRAMTTQIAEQTDALQAQLDSLPADRTPASSTSSSTPPTSILPALLSSITDLSTALPAFSRYHSGHIAPHRRRHSQLGLGTGALCESLCGVVAVRSAMLAGLRCGCGLGGVVSACSGACESVLSHGVAEVVGVAAAATC